MPDYRPGDMLVTPTGHVAATFESVTGGVVRLRWQSTGTPVTDVHPWTLVRAGLRHVRPEPASCP
jgi:hypothetical protein